MNLRENEKDIEDVEKKGMWQWLEVKQRERNVKSKIVLKFRAWTGGSRRIKKEIRSRKSWVEAWRMWDWFDLWFQRSWSKIQVMFDVRESSSTDGMRAKEKNIYIYGVRTNWWSKKMEKIHGEHNGMGGFQKRILSKMLGRHWREKQTL